MKYIKVKNAKINNLKNIDLNIPKNKLVVVTGVSGSGKSSFVFDILFNEGSHRYLESLGYPQGISAKETCDSIEGLPPAVAVKQRLLRYSNPRSVVGTRTGIYEYLKMLFFTEGSVKCNKCGAKTDKNLICVSCGNKMKRPSLQSFSFNSPMGMCLKCMGRGTIGEVDSDKLIPDPKAPLKKICNYLPVTPKVREELNMFVKKFNVNINDSFENLSDEAKEVFLYGAKGKFWGIVPNLKYKMLKGKSIGVYGRVYKCPACLGFRIGEEGRSIKLNGIHIAEAASMSIKGLKKFLYEFRDQETISSQGKNNLEFIINQLDNLIDSDLDYLTLFRPIPTLSGGEMQRLFLMQQLKLNMDSLLYIFDEPTAGLHEIEKGKLLDKIELIRNQGNSVVVVEHDKNTINRAEHIIDFGPLAGSFGGEVVFEGEFKELIQNKKSLTGQYMSKQKQIMRKSEYKLIEAKTQRLKIINADTNYLKNICVEIPLDMMVGIAGVSGSGKSSLISHTLIPLLKKYFCDLDDNNDNDDENIENDNEDLIETKPSTASLEGAEHISGFVEISQSPIGRNNRSNSLTYLGIWDRVRNLFASQVVSKEMGFTSSHFSFNSKGACSCCKGSGYLETVVGELGTLTSVCPECNGSRYCEDVLKIKYKGKSIVDILDMSVTDGYDFFREDEMISYMLDKMVETGMGYIKLGQPMPTISGGEAQRIKLAMELGRKHKKGYLYILDEPTTGLSFDDSAKLLKLLNNLVESGNSVIVIEHDPDILSFCDYIIELGPGSADKGGEVISKGTPMELKNNPDSITGKFLCNP